VRGPKLGEFEPECQRRKLKLYALPARSPHLNGGVKRCNGADWQDTYNFVRAHGALSGLTQSEYYSPAKPRRPRAV
jgi:transposase InsO family protein